MVVDRREQTLIVTGISRSGTSLFTVLLNLLDDVVAFNEVLPLELDALPGALDAVHGQLMAGEPVRNKFRGDGLATDTLQPGVVKREEAVAKPLTPDVRIATNRNLTYLNQLGDFVAGGWRVVVLVRDPVFTLASWSTARAVEHGIPGALAGVEDRHPHLADVALDDGATLIERRAQVWEHYAARIWAHRAHAMIVPFEVLTQRPLLTLSAVARYCGAPQPPESLDLGWVRPDRNDPDRHAPRLLRSIRDAVTRLCPTRLALGYRD